MRDALRAGARLDRDRDVVRLGLEEVGQAGADGAAAVVGGGGDDGGVGAGVGDRRVEDDVDRGGAAGRDRDLVGGQRHRAGRLGRAVLARSGRAPA